MKSSQLSLSFVRVACGLSLNRTELFSVVNLWILVVLYRITSVKLFYLEKGEICDPFLEIDLNYALILEISNILIESAKLLLN